jgi:hypothetical protein
MIIFSVHIYRCTQGEGYGLIVVLLRSYVVSCSVHSCVYYVTFAAHDCTSKAIAERMLGGARFHNCHQQ